jgi:pimeloyl-ACP methyl ester carboxylesterase/DNA-binding CsgD family transcriptional regulator
MSRQRIRYVRSTDGTRLAWADAGRGPVIVKAANWLTHLEYDLESPVWRHWLEFFSDHFRLIRYDERGSGMSDWDVDLSFDRWLDDFERVVEAADLPDPFTLLGVSQGAAVSIAYAVKHPERVSRLILYGGYARGWARREHPAGQREYEAIVELVRAGWGRSNPAFRQVFTSRFIPRGSDEQIEWFNELCRKTTTPETAATLLNVRATIDVLPLLPQVRTPTLVIHARNDAVTPIHEGRILAEGIPGAEFVELDSENHILLRDEPAWSRFRDVILEFMGSAALRSDDVFGSLSPREREVLALLAEGLGNAQVAARLSISEKTVRNHVSRLFDKLGVWTRAQAIVFARDRGFRA